MGKIIFGGRKFESAPHLHGVRFWKLMFPPDEPPPRMRVYQYLGTEGASRDHLFLRYRGKEIRVVGDAQLFKFGFTPFLLDLKVIREVHKDSYPKLLE